MDTVNGNDILLFLGDDASPTNYKQVVCLTNLTWGRTKSTTSTVTKCGTFKSNGSKDYSCTATGLQMENVDGDTEYGIEELIDLFTDDTPKKWKIGPAVPVAGNMIKTFEGVVNTLNETYGAEGFATFDLTINPDPTTVDESPYATAINTLTTQSVAPGNVSTSSADNILYIAKWVNTSSQTPSAIACTLTGTFDASDLASVHLYINGNAALDGNEQEIAEIVSTSDTAPHTYNFPNSNPFAPGTHYLIVTADIGASADAGHTIVASKLSLTGVGTTSDTQTTTGGTKTVF